MLEFSDVAVAHAIELAVAPVFLLTGIGAILAIMINRLGRVIDRARVLEERSEGFLPSMPQRCAQTSPCYRGGQISTDARLRYAA